jgi:hypothetical protein
MIPKSGCRFSEKIMFKQQAKAKYRFNLKSFRFSRTRLRSRAAQGRDGGEVRTLPQPKDL